MEKTTVNSMWIATINVIDDSEARLYWVKPFRYTFPWMIFTFQKNR
jgi:hypothetical protein